MKAHTYKLLYIVFLLAVMVGTMQAQSYIIEKADMNQGLESNDILCTAQDCNGVIYVGTGGGLYRFNGYNFETFPSESERGGEEGITGHAVFRILTDGQSDTLWVTVDDKVKVIHTLNYDIKNYDTLFPADSASKQTLVDACFASDGKLWLLPKQGTLRLLSLHTGNVSPISIRKGEFPHASKNLCLAKDDNGILYIGHQGEGLSVYNPQTQVLKRYTFQPGTGGLPGNEVTDICIDSRRQVWIATHWGLALFNPQTEQFVTFTHEATQKHTLSDSDIHSIREIDGKLWIGTWRGGVNILDLNTFDLPCPEDTRFEHITAGDLSSRLSSPSIVDIFNDSFGNIWLGSARNGLNIIPHIPPFFHTITYSPLREEKNGLSDKAILSLCHDGMDNLWIGTDNGNIDIYHQSSATSLYEKREHLHMGGGITALAADRAGMIWMGIDKIGLVRYNPQTRRSQKIQLGTDPYFRTYIYALCQGKNGDMWIGTHDGLFICKSQAEKTEPAGNALLHSAGAPVYSIMEDSQNNLWMTIEGKIFIITPQGRQVKEFSFQSGYINCLYRDTKGRMWIAEGENLHYTTVDDTEKYRLHTIHTVKEWNSSIRSIIDGADGSLWMSDSRRIIRYLPERDELQFFDRHEGVPEAIFKPRCSTRIDDLVFFAQQNGICYFDSRKSMPTYVLPPLRIMSFTVESQAGQEELPLQQEMKLEHGQNSFTLHCGISDYALREKVEYAYSLDKEQWFPVTHGNDITFRNLSHGSYTLYIRARIHNQNGANSIVSLKVCIAPPLWLTWWAKLLYVSVCLVAAFFMVRLYKRRLQQKSLMQLEHQQLEQEQRLNDEKLRFYTNVTHELRTPLTLILGPLEDLEAEKMEPTQTKKITMIRKSAYRLYELVNQILEFRKSETHNRTLKVAQEDLSILVHEVTLKYQELNTNEKVRIDCFTERPCRLWYDKEVITIILDNILSNALKYTPHGKIEVILRQQTAADGVPYTEISVSDTGYGIPREALGRVFDRYYQANGKNQVFGTGIGLALVKKLVELHQGSISVESEEGKGSTFCFRIRTDNEYPDAVHVAQPIAINSQKTETQVPDANKPILLIVEDNEDIRTYIADSFCLDFEILTAANGREGIDIAVERLPDIIVSDIMMPVVDGIELCQTLKQDARTSHIPIILLTAKDTEDNKTEGYLHGADSYITKPFSVQLLKSRIKNLLQNREKIAEYFTSGTYKKKMAMNAASQLDNEFMEKVYAAIEKNIHEEQINITTLAESMNMSYSTFYRKMKALTGITTNELIRKIKMQHAEKMILSKRYTINEIMLEIGYNSRTAFREAFKAEYRVSPSKYIESIESPSQQQ